MKRETPEDLLKQKRLLQVFSEKMDLEFNQFPSFSKKYRIDGYCYDKKTYNVVCWIECKWYNNKAHFFLNVPKFNELIRLSELTKKPSYLLFREYDKWGYILLHDGFNITCSYSTKLSGGTPVGRVKNEDDLEPLIVLDKNNINWGNA